MVISHFATSKLCSAASEVCRQCWAGFVFIPALVLIFLSLCVTCRIQCDKIVNVGSSFFPDYGRLHKRKLFFKTGGSCFYGSPVWGGHITWCCRLFVLLSCPSSSGPWIQNWSSWKLHYFKFVGNIFLARVPLIFRTADALLPQKSA